jgi:hypothetical protein
MKVDCASRKLASLNREVGAVFASVQPHPYAIFEKHSADRRHHTFRLYPRWEREVGLRWGVTLGEVVHDLRSALDHLVWQLVRLNAQIADHMHSFPIYLAEPAQGFLRSTTWKRGDRHGPLRRVSRDAIRVIEGCQPYNGGDCILLHILNDLWNIDKHRHLLPVLALTDEPAIHLRNAELVEMWTERSDEDGANIVHVTVDPTGSDPHVDVQPGLPRDVAFGDGTAAIDQLLDTARYIITGVVTPLNELYPGPPKRYG